MLFFGQQYVSSAIHQMSLSGSWIFGGISVNLVSLFSQAGQRGKLRLTWGRLLIDWIKQKSAWHLTSAKHQQSGREVCTYIGSGRGRWLGRKLGYRKGFWLTGMANRGQGHWWNVTAAWITFLTQSEGDRKQYNWNIIRPILHRHSDTPTMGVFQCKALSVSAVSGYM